ncbi:MerR family transcriptional regulator [Paenibacillus gorillae]|uniref:MerR family transcriptional regulator n=1 Tax=Paenibacillus gorillae TaxID=1243662 RepID=UPI0004BA4070|nr:MerR family transcriptional regulator [Paenibacillus gorillae]
MAKLGIAEVSKNSGLSYDTIRYYEKIGLIPRAVRKENGQLEFDAIILDRLFFINCLKRTDMPLKEIQRYMNSVNKQESENCYEILKEHRRSIESQMNVINETLKIINYKIDNFERLKNSQTAERIAHANDDTLDESQERQD